MEQSHLAEVRQQVITRHGQVMQTIAGLERDLAHWREERLRLEGQDALLVNLLNTPVLTVEAAPPPEGPAAETPTA